MADLDKKLLAKTAKEKLNSGKTKQEAYEELVEEFGYREEVANTIVHIPSAERLKKYGIWNSLYLAFLILVTILSLLNPSGGLIWLAWLIYIVTVRKFKYYYWNTILGGTGFIGTVAVIAYYGTNSWIALIAVIAVSVIFIMGGVYLPKLLTPGFRTENEVYVNDNGENRLLVKHVFEE